MQLPLSDLDLKKDTSYLIRATKNKETVVEWSSNTGGEGAKQNRYVSLQRVE